MDIKTTINLLDEPKLATLRYVSHFTKGEVFSIDGMNKYYPFIKHLFSEDPEELEAILGDLSKKDLIIKQDAEPKTYKCAPEVKRDIVWQAVRKRLIQTDKCFVRDKMYPIIKDIQLYDFLEFLPRQVLLSMTQSFSHQTVQKEALSDRTPWQAQWTLPSQFLPPHHLL